MKAGAALVLELDPRSAGARAATEAREQLGGSAPSLAVLFASPHFLGTAEALLEAVRDELGPVPLIGCVAESVVGGSREIEGEPAVSLWLAADAGPVETFSMEFVRTSAAGVFSGWHFDHGTGSAGMHLLLCDPFTFPADGLLQHLNQNAPGALVMGGMASGGLPAGQSRLFLDGTVRSSGAVGAWLAGAEVHPLVSQGCRPIGSPFTITAAQDHLIVELGGRPPLERLQELAVTLPEHDRELVSRGLHIGKVIDEYRAELHRGDFLIRGVIGVEPESGAMAVGDEVEVGQTVQFHVRDADSADEDLREALDRELAGLRGRRTAGALLFTCNGRGSRLFAEPDHDAALLAKTLGDVPVAGFFCAGELGPVGGKNFLHGFTASIALFPEEDGAGSATP
ncbi:MAG: FIST C-terminal domain-containing protein [Actinomycetota bacterium]|nr:FIST C-terminal domain-containing protein [Actinomycetota bacterium]